MGTKKKAKAKTKADTKKSVRPAKKFVPNPNAVGMAMGKTIAEAKETKAVNPTQEQHREWARILCDNKREKEHRSAANGIYKAFHDSLIFYFGLKIGTKADILDLQDLTMETLEKAFKSIKQYNSEKAALSTWVFRIALNCLVDHIRRNKFNDVVSVEAMNAHNVTSMGEADAELFELRSNDPSPLESTDRTQRHETVRKAITSMKNKSERKVVELRFLKEYTYEEIAEALDMPMGTVKALIFRATKERLKGTLNAGLELERA